MDISIALFALAGFLIFLGTRRSDTTPSSPSATGTTPTAYQVRTPTSDPLAPPELPLGSLGAPIWGYKPDTSLDDLYNEWGQRSGIDPLLLKAIALQESNQDINALGAAGEVGLMQVLCIPDASGYCTASFNLPGWEGTTAAELEDPNINLQFATGILRWDIDYAQGDLTQALAMYNGGVNPPASSYEYASQVIGRWNNLRVARGLPEIAVTWEG